MEGDIKQALQRIIQAVRLDLRRQYAFPMKARVLKVYLEANGYCCDVQPLRNNGQVAEMELPAGGREKLQPIQRVAINPVTNGAVRGFFALPAVGAIVRVSFYGGDWNWPFVDAVIASRTPALQEPEEVAIYRDAGTSIILRSGLIEVHCPNEVHVTAPTVHVNAQDVYLGTSASKGVARLGDKVVVDSRTHEGTIVEASEHVRAI